MENITQDINIFKANIKVFGEMLAELVPGKEGESDLELLNDLYSNCQSMQNRIVELLNTVGNEKIIEDLLLLNDELNNLFQKYKSFQHKRDSIGKSGVLKEDSVNSKNLIDFEDNGESKLDYLNRKFGDLKVVTSNWKSSLESSKVENNSDMPDLSSSNRLQFQNNTRSGMSNAAQTTEREEDFHEMARWLEDKPENLQDMHDTSKTEEEFERFLAERAAAAENLPTIRSDNHDLSYSANKTTNSNK